MQRMLVAVAAFAASAWGGFALAGDYHISTTLRCSQCHTMHASRQHDLNGASEDADYPIAKQGNPQRNLLMHDGTNETCLACHDSNASYPDVLGLNVAGNSFGTDSATAGQGRSAGALNGTTASHSAGGSYQGYMGHTLGSGDAPPGWVGVYEATPQENFNCANCHAVHGSNAYRNLGLSQYMGTPNHAKDATNPFLTAGPTYNPVDVATDVRASTTFDPANDVTVGVSGRSYKTTDVTFGSGTGGMNAYCAVCHGNFHGDANTKDLVGGVDFVRHPTTGVTRMVAGGTPLLASAQTDLVRPAWSAAPGPTSNFQAACLSCHKGHGNLRGYALVYPSNTGAVSNYEEGDAPATVVGSTSVYPLRELCITCHGQGR